MANRNKNESITEEQLLTTLEFAEGLYNGFNGYHTPFTQNQNLINLTNVDSKKPTAEKAINALTNAKINPTELQGYSEFLNIFDTIYNKVMEYYNGILSYDLRISCKNIKNPKDYNSKQYKEDLNRVYKFLDSFDYKQEFKKVTKQVLKSGVSFNWFRDSIGTYNEDNDALEIEKQRNFALQILPQNKCLITGYFNKGSILFDFDMNYFLNSTVDIDLFDPWFKLQYAKIWKKTDNNYNPSNSLKNRDDNYANYIQTSPTNGAWCFKWNTDNFYIIPPFSSLIKSAINNDVVADLQLDKDIISAYLLLAGEIGVMDGAKSGNKANQTKFNGKTLGEFMNLVTSGLKRNVKAVAMPLENIRGWQYNDQNPNMLDTQYNTTASQSVSASRLIYSNGKMSQSELQNAILTDYNIVSQLYSQYENFLEFFINKKTKKYKFSFAFSGSNYIFEREARQKSLMDLSSIGLTLGKSAWASAYGFKPQEFDRLLEEAHYGSLVDNLTLLMNKNTMNSNDSNVGNPKKNDNDVKDSGEESRDYE